MMPQGFMFTGPALAAPAPVVSRDERSVMLDGGVRLAGIHAVLPGGAQGTLHV